MRYNGGTAKLYSYSVILYHAIVYENALNITNRDLEYLFT